MARAYQITPQLLALLALALVSSPASLSADVNPFVELLPSLRSLPAPPGAVEGLRITYYSSAATIPSVYHSYHLDENGDWVDENGNRYRREEEPGEGGHGYTQVDVVALSGRGAVLHVASWGLQPAGGVQVAVPITAGSFISDTPAAGGDYWLHPTALAGAPAKATGELKILNMPYTIGQKTFQAVRFQYEKENSRMVYVYDRETGVLLHSNSMVKSDVRTMLSQNTLVNIRQVKWPWANAAKPSWLATFTGMRGAGSYTVAVPNTMPSSFPLQVTMEVLAHGDKWISYRQTSVMGSLAGMPPSLPDVRVLVSGAAQFGGLWIPPAGLAVLQDGQTLDEDPTTGVKVSVAAAAAQVDGCAAVVFNETGGAHTTAYAYDKATGLLIHFTQDSRLLNTRIDLSMRR